MANFLHAKGTVRDIYLIKSNGGFNHGKKIILLGGCLFFSFALTTVLFAQDDIKQHPACKYCGMDRANFAHSRFYVVYENGETQGTCSLHCAAIEFAVHIDKTPKTMQVGDYYTKILVDAEKAFWVLGGNKPGVMTQRAKWAFGKKEDAENSWPKTGGFRSLSNRRLKRPSKTCMPTPR